MWPHVQISFTHSPLSSLFSRLSIGVFCSQHFHFLNHKVDFGFQYQKIKSHIQVKLACMEPVYCLAWIFRKIIRLIFDYKFYSWVKLNTNTSYHSFRSKLSQYNCYSVAECSFTPVKWYMALVTHIHTATIALNTEHWTLASTPLIQLVHNNKANLLNKNDQKHTFECK